MLVDGGKLTLNQRLTLTELNVSSVTVNRNPFNPCKPVDNPTNSSHYIDGNATVGSGRLNSHLFLRPLATLPLIRFAKAR